MDEDEPIEHTMVTKAIENAQRKVEGHNFDIRKHLLEYDDVMNKQREVIYTRRRAILEGEEVHEIIEEIMQELVEGIADEFAETNTPSEEWNWQGLADRMAQQFNVKLEWSEEGRKDLSRDTLLEKLKEAAAAAYAAREQANGGPDQMRQLERMVYLQMLDTLWKEHLLQMDHLKEGIGLRGYGQKNPLLEYKREGFDLFAGLIQAINQYTVGNLMRIQIVHEETLARMEEEQREARERELEQAERNARAQAEAEAAADRKQQPVLREEEKIGRNAPCPCGSGKKYKKCCGREV